MTITVELPDDVSTHSAPGREALEALVIAGYRTGALSTRDTRILLGFKTRYELDGFLKANEVWEHAYGIADFEQDIATLDGLQAAGKMR